MSIQSDKISNDLLEAVRIITESVIDSKKDYDQTLIYTIKDNSTAEKGYYTVTDGFISMEATSDNKNYQIDDKVYVMIPGGKFSNNKIILGKVPAETEEDTNVEQQVKTCEDIVGVNKGYCDFQDKANLIVAPNSNQQEIYYGKAQEFIWETEATSADYTRLQLNTSSLFDFGFKNILSGNYGIKLLVQSTLDDYVYTPDETQESYENLEKIENIYTETDEPTIINQYHYTELEFDVTEMNGQVYTTFTLALPQTKVFDISNIPGRIIKIIAQPYLKNNFTFNEDGTIEPYPLSNKNLHSVAFENTQLILGYDQNEFTEDCLKLYTYDTLGYKYNQEGMDRLKHLKCRWIKFNTEDSRYHAYEETATGVIIDSLTEEPLSEEESKFCVFWYEEKAGKYSDYLGKNNYERIGISPYVLGDKNLNDYYKILYEAKNPNIAWTDSLNQNTEMNSLLFEQENYHWELESQADRKGIGQFVGSKEKLGTYYLPNIKSSAHCIKAVLIQYKDLEIENKIWDEWITQVNTIKAVPNILSSSIIGLTTKLDNNFSTQANTGIAENSMVLLHKKYKELIVDKIINNSDLQLNTYNSIEDLILQREQLNFYEEIYEDLSLTIQESINNFAIYDNQGMLFEQWKNTIFHMEADYSSLEAINLRKNIQTTWHIPLTNTMILNPLADKTEKLQEKDINFYELDANIFSDSYYSEHMIKGYIETEKITGEKFLCLVFMDENDFSLHNILPFKLKSNYNNKFKNNIIYCSIQFNYLEIYQGQKIINLEIGSSAGTGYYLVPIFNDNKLFNVTKGGGLESEIIIEPRLSFQGIEIQDWKSISKYRDQSLFDTETKKLGDIHCKFVSYNTCELEEWSGTESQVYADKHTYRFKNDELKVIIESINDGQNYKISLKAKKENNINLEENEYLFKKVIKQFYNGYFELSILLDTTDDNFVELTHQFVIPVRFDNYIGEVSCSDGIIEYDSTHKLKSNFTNSPIQAYGQQEQIEQEYSEIYRGSPTAPIIVDNGISTKDKEFIKFKSTDPLIGIKNMPYSLEPEKDGQYLTIVRGPKKLKNIQNIGDDVPIPVNYHNLEIILQYQGKGQDECYWFKFIKGRRKSQSYINWGNKIQTRSVIEWKDIIYDDLKNTGLNELKNKTCKDIDNNGWYSYLSENLYDYYWKFKLSENNEEEDYPDSDTEYTYCDSSNSAPQWADKMLFKPKLAIINLQSKEYLNNSIQEFSKINANLTEKVEINIYYKSQESGITLNNMLKKRYIRDGGKYIPVILKHLYDTTYCIDQSTYTLTNRGTYELYQENDIKQKYNIYNIQLIPERQFIGGKEYRRLYTYTISSDSETPNLLVKNYELPAQKIYNELLDYCKNSTKQNNFNIGYWWANSPKHIELQVTGAWSKTLNFDLYCEYYNKNKELKEDYLTNIFAEMQGQIYNPEAPELGLRVLYVDIEPTYMNKVLGPYYDTEKSIDYFYDFRVVRYHYGIKSADGSIPETEVTWRKLGRDSEQRFDAFSLTKDKKTNNYFLNPFPFYIDNMTPPSILGLLTINKGSSSETIECWLQPFIIKINKYNNNILNSWQGDYVSNGQQIFSAVMGAGKKNLDNTFSGIFLGEVNQTEGLVGTYGLYGYNKGIQVFGFNDDGRAFIGGEGARLQLNNDADGGLSIMTGGFEDNNIDQGVKIDFTDNYLHLKNSNKLYQSFGVGADTDEESINFSTKNNEMFLTSNQDEYSYPFSITSDNNNIQTSIDWLGNYSGNSFTAGSNYIGPTGVYIENGASDDWVTTRSLGRIKVQLIDKINLDEEDGNKIQSHTEYYEIKYYSVFTIEKINSTNNLVCYSFYRLIPTSSRTDWLYKHYLNSEDMKIYEEFKEKFDKETEEFKTEILDFLKTAEDSDALELIANFKDTQIKLYNFLIKLRELYRTNRAHIDNNFNLRSTIHADPIQLYNNGPSFNNLIYLGEFVKYSTVFNAEIEKEETSYEFRNNMKNKYFSYFNKFNVNTAAFNTSENYKAGDEETPPNNFNKYYWQGLMGGIYTQQSNLPNPQKDSAFEHRLAVFYAPAGRHLLSSNSDYFEHRVRYKTIIGDEGKDNSKSGWATEYDEANISIKIDKYTQLCSYMIPPQVKSGYSLYWYRQTQAYRPFQLPVPQPEHTVKSVLNLKDVNYTQLEELSRIYQINNIWSIEFDPALIYKNTIDSTAFNPKNIAPTMMELPKGTTEQPNPMSSKIKIIYQNVLINNTYWGKAEADEWRKGWMVQYGYYNPFVTWSSYIGDDKKVKWTSGYTTNYSGFAATLNRLQGKFAGFTKFSMANLLKYWLNPDNQNSSIPEVQINIRGANKFGLDLIDVVHDENHIFRITADGQVLINGKVIT